MVEPEDVSEELADYQLNPNVVPTQAPIITTRWETSGNWSGAYIEPRNDTVLSEVSAHWTIPDLSMVPKPNVTHSSSIWVGLDGQRLYFNSSLPQIGTTQAIDKNGNIDYHAWYQWWARNQTNPRPHRIKVFSISAGDEIFSHVQTVNATHVIVSIAKLNPPKQFWSRKRRAPIYLAGPYINDHPKISGATAQWVVERPTKLNTDDLIPLVDYGRVDFRRCWASVAPEPGAPAAGYQTLDGARFIRMHERRNKPARIAMISSPLRRLMTGPTRGIQGRLPGPLAPEIVAARHAKPWLGASRPSRPVQCQSRRLAHSALADFRRSSWRPDPLTRYPRSGTTPRRTGMNGAACPVILRSACRSSCRAAYMRTTSALRRRRRCSSN